MSLTSQEGQLLSLFAERLRAAEDPFWRAISGQVADTLRQDLPDLDDTTIARVILALGGQLIYAAQVDPELVRISVIVNYVAAQLAGPALAIPEEAGDGRR